MIKTIKRWIKNEEGAVLPLAALVTPLVIGMVGLGADGSVYVMQKSNLQTAADAAALAGAWEIGKKGDNFIQSTVLNAAEDNGFKSAEGTLSLSMRTEANGFSYVTATVTQEASLWFSSIIFKDPFDIKVSAEALVEDEYDGKYCILALDKTISGSFTTSGSVEISAPSCGLAVNSNNESAIEINGNVTLDFGEVRIGGSYEISGGSADFNYQNIFEHAPL